jgi:hypothetical protein
MTTKQNENDQDRATDVLIEAMKRMQALNIDALTAFGATVTYLAEWMLHQEGGHEILLNVATYMQRRVIEEQVKARMVPVPAHSAN